MRNRKLELMYIWLIIFLFGISSFSFAQITLTIEQALDIAEENNPSLRSSKLSLERSIFNLEAQRATLKPQFSISVDPLSYSQNRSFDNRYSEWYTNKTLSSSGTFRMELPFLLTDGTLTLTDRFGWQDSESMNQSGTNYNKAFTNNLQLRYNQPLFTYNRQKMQFKQLEFEYENAGIRYALQRLSIESRITSQFYSVYTAQENLIISNAEYDNTKLNYDILKNRVEAGMSPREELFQAEVNLLSAESQVESNIVSLSDAKDNLKQTLGMPLNDDISVIVDITFSPLLVNLDRAVQNGLSSRMELRQREIEIEKADLQMIVTKSLNEFRGNVSLSVGIVGDNERLSNIYSNPTSSPGVLISFNIPIFDWGERKARIKAQQTTQTIAKLDYENEVIDIELGVRQILRRLGYLSDQVQIAETRLRNAQNSYDLNNIKYREGDISGMEINQYQAQLSSAKAFLMQARINYKIQLLNLKIATLYDFENDKTIVPVRELSNIRTK